MAARKERKQKFSRLSDETKRILSIMVGYDQMRYGQPGNENDTTNRALRLYAEKCGVDIV